MKISAYHKAQGDEVSWYMNFETYDRVYINKISKATPQDKEIIQAPRYSMSETGTRNRRSGP